MKSKLFIAIFLLAAAFARAQTNSLTSLLQQGLLEEQANHNFDAAIANYKTLAGQFDKDRQLAATAIFRLGECYRAEGRTNEAAAQYQRIIQQFADQQTLATLSRQDLLGMGMAAGQPETAPTANSDAILWNKLKGKSEADLEVMLPTILPDATLSDLLQKRNEAEVRRASLVVDYSTTNVVVTRTDALITELNREIHAKVDGMMLGLKLRAEMTSSAAIGNTVSSQAGAADLSQGEDQEIIRIQQMIQNSPDLINVPSSGSTPLVKAAYNGWLKVAGYLLDHGADVNAWCARIPGRGDLFGGGAWHVTPLLAAVEAGNRAMTQFLIERGADVHFQDPNGNTPLHIAAESGFQAVAETLLANHADVNVQNFAGASPLFAAVQYRHLKIIQMLVAAKANANLKDHDGHTVLNFAIKTSPELMQMLLAAGADPNTVDKDRRTPLSYAAERDTSQIVGLLLAAKADPNGGTMDVPLSAAVQIQEVASAELLLKAGADANARDRINWGINLRGSSYPQGGEFTPLFLAVHNGQLPMVRLLLKYKANPNDTESDGESLLYLVLDKPDIVKALLDAGADANAIAKPQPIFGTINYSFGNVNAGNYYHETLLQSAASENQPETVVLLLEHGAQVNACEERGNSALHYAAYSKADEKIFRLLLDHKASPNVRNAEGKTPLDILKDTIGENNPWLGRFSNIDALKNHAKAMIALLHQYGALDNLPDWDRIKLARPTANYSTTVFYKNTNDWNHFTLLEALYENAQAGQRLGFPDLAHIIIARPSADGSTIHRINVNLTDTNGVLDCNRDVPLEFGDVVEVPEREHTLADPWRSLSPWQFQAISDHFRRIAGDVTLIVAGGQTVKLPLEPFHTVIKSVLQLGAARAALTSNSDLAHIKVTRHDAQTNQTHVWIVDCSNLNDQTTPDLRLRAGDVLEVPQK